MLAFCFSTIVLVVVGGTIVIMLLGNGSIKFDIARQIAATLNSHVGGGYVFEVGSTAIAGTSSGPSLAISGLTVRDGRGRAIITAPRAMLAVDPLSLAVGQVSPKRLELQALTLSLVRLPDGTIALSGGADDSADVSLANLASTLSDPHDAANPTGPALPPAAPDPAASPDAAPTPLPALVAKAVTAASDALFGSGSPLRAVDRFGVSGAKLVVDDRLRGTQTTYTNLDIDVDREATGSIYVTVAADGPAGHWSGNARVSRAADGTRKLDLAADRLSPDELMLAAGVRAAGFETDMPLSFSLSVEIGPDGKLRHAGGPVSFGAGYFKLDDPDHEPAMVDRFDTVLTMDPVTGALGFGEGVLVADATRFDFRLDATPPQKTDGAWAVTGRASGRLGAERPGEGPIKIDGIAFHARVFAASHQMMLDEASASGPTIDFKMNAAFQPTEAGFLITSDMTMGKMPGPDVIRLWPNWVASPVRAWLLRSLQGGAIEWGKGHLSLTKQDLDTMRRQHSVPDDHVHIEFGASNASLAFMEGVPALRGLDGKGVITGDSFKFIATKAEMDVSPGHRLVATEGSMIVPTTDPKPTPAVIALHVTGAIDTAAELLSRDALKPYANLPIDATTVAGAFDGRLTINLKVGKDVPKEETKISVAATVTNFSATKVIGKEPLQNATLAVTADATGLRAKGDGRMFGAPASVELKKPAGGGASEASLLLTLDDAARQKAGFGLGKAVTGAITAKITTSFTPAEKNKAAVTLDFTRCTFDSPIPGLKKAADRPAKASFSVLQEPTRSVIDQIVFDSGSTAIRGSAVLDANGDVASASLSQMRISPGDDAKVDITRAGDAFKVTVRGRNLDARPFLKYITAGETNSSDVGAKELDLDIRATLLTGQNGQAISGIDLKLDKRGNLLRHLSMTGRIGRGPISADSTPQGGAAVMVVSAKDGGALLSFLDLYKRMDGGQLDATLKFGDNRVDGSTTIRNFTIREDPSIKKLAEEQIPGGSPNAGAKIDPSAVAFTKLEALFTRVGNKIDVRQGSMFGPQIGATVDGTIDFAHDKVALAGTLVPLYGLNNLFSQIPVVGMLLGGGSHEGLFALNYRITGSASAPVFTFNPLSALAPGFLRKIFGAIDDAAQQGTAPHDQGGPPATPPAMPE